MTGTGGRAVGGGTDLRQLHRVTFHDRGHSVRPNRLQGGTQLTTASGREFGGVSDSPRGACKPSRDTAHRAVLHEDREARNPVRRIPPQLRLGPPRAHIGGQPRPPRGIPSPRLNHPRPRRRCSSEIAGLVPTSRLRRGGGYYQYDSLKRTPAFEETSHFSLTGESGPGTCDVLRNILSGVALRPEYWESIVIDGIASEGNIFENNKNIRFYTPEKASRQQVTEVLQNIVDNVKRVSKEKHYKTPKRHLLIVVNKTNDNSETLQDSQERIAELLYFLLRTGRSAGIHILLNKTTDKSIILDSSQAEISFDTRITLGHRNGAGAHDGSNLQKGAKTDIGVVNYSLKEMPVKIFYAPEEALKRNIAWYLANNGHSIQ